MFVCERNKDGKRVTKLRFRCTEETHSAAGLTDKVYVELPLRELTRGKETNNEDGRIQEQIIMASDRKTIDAI